MKTLASSYIDLDPLKEEVEGNTTLCKMLIKSFMADIDAYVIAMNGALPNNNFPALYQVAHKIIPSIRIFNIVKLEPIIIQLETDLRDQNDLECITNNINASLRIFYQVKIELQNELKSLENAET
ncbi:hypothetical protein [Gelidibacter salicanalis]|uniref:HPt domain-containing protein n=1 Tax=Gelidibacter salicanalis TaxID=291193 RepID=A0A934NDL4_9FLAO|nr:hypothetical protein [Gelidibacter salicanalis]MBJ7881835.1 hypothetical protein [Gelidibacter salicanalis]